MQNDVRPPERIHLELRDLLLQSAGGVVGVHQDAAKHEHRVLWVYGRQAVVARLVKEQQLHKIRIPCRPRL